VIKILQIIPTLDQSGAEKQFAQLAVNLPKNQYEVHPIILTRSGPYESLLRAADLPVTVLHKRLKFDPFALWKLGQQIRRQKPDIIHSWLFAANAYTRLLAGQTPKPKVIVSERCVDSWKQSWQLWLDRRQFARTTWLVGNSQSVVDFYIGQGMSAEKTSVIPNGIAIPQTALSQQQRDEKLAEFDIPAGARVVGCVGRIARQKRLQDLIWAMQLLRQLTDNVFLLVIGEGPQRDQLLQFAREMTCDHVTRFVGHRSDAVELISLLDVFWIASDFEGMSNSLMEAMAAGVPVVASDIPPNRELVIDGETGFFVKVGDSAGFAQFTDRILADGRLQQRLGDAGQARMREQFSIENMVERYGALYQQVLAEY